NLPIALDEALAMVLAAHEHARQEGLHIAAAVVDEGGFLQALGRMDTAPPLASQIAEAKAVGAALWHRQGHELLEVHRERAKFFDQVDRLVRMPLIPGPGSLLIRRAGRVLGAIGISGALPEQDLACAEAALGSVAAEGKAPKR